MIGRLAAAMRGDVADGLGAGQHGRRFAGRLGHAVAAREQPLRVPVQVGAHGLVRQLVAARHALGIPAADDLLVVEQVHGHSTNTGPGTPVSETSSASMTAGARSRSRFTARAYFTCGAISGIWSMSCSAPRFFSAVAVAPPSTSTGDCASCAFFSGVMVLVRPGSGGHGRDAGDAGEPRVGVGGEHGGGLVAHVGDADADALGLDEDRRDVAAAQREDFPDPAVVQDPGDACSAVHRTFLSVVRRRPRRAA
jgi:hypothetical protein